MSFMNRILLLCYYLRYQFIRNLNTDDIASIIIAVIKNLIAAVFTFCIGFAVPYMFSNIGIEDRNMYYLIFGSAICSFWILMFSKRSNYLPYDTLRVQPFRKNLLMFFSFLAEHFDALSFLMLFYMIPIYFLHVNYMEFLICGVLIGWVDSVYVRLLRNSIDYKSLKYLLLALILFFSHVLIPYCVSCAFSLDKRIYVLECVVCILLLIIGFYISRNISEIKRNLSHTVFYQGVSMYKMIISSILRSNNISTYVFILIFIVASPVVYTLHTGIYSGFSETFLWIAPMLILPAQLGDEAFARILSSFGMFCTSKPELLLDYMKCKYNMVLVMNIFVLIIEASICGTGMLTKLFFTFLIVTGFVPCISFPAHAYLSNPLNQFGARSLNTNNTYTIFELLMLIVFVMMLYLIIEKSTVGMVIGGIIGAIMIVFNQIWLKSIYKLCVRNKSNLFNGFNKKR